MRSLLVVGCLAVMGCAGVDDGSDGLGRNGSAVSSGPNNGTDLDATTAAGATTCDGASGSVSFSGTVTTTGAVDSVEITASVDGGGAMTLGTIQPQDFTHDGRNKHASYTISVPVPNGTHSVEICFVQSGANGRLSKTTCLAAVSVTVDCQEKPKCNQGVGNGSEGCDPGNSNHNQPSNDENGGTPGNPGRGK